MLKAVQRQGRLIRVPAHVLERTRHHVYDSDGSKQQPPGQKDETSGAQDMTEPEGEFSLLREAMRDPLSLDASMTEDGLDLQAVTMDDNTKLPEDQLIDQDLIRKIRASLATLPSREETILRLRYGLDFPSSRTLEEVGQLFNLSKERIRQIEARALRRLYMAQAS
jgi:RNA polymerase primary sigma factor